MQNSVLLSIKPIYAELIFKNQKRYEFRKALFKDRSVNKVYVYASAPISKVIGEFTIDDILELEPGLLWTKTNEFAGISKEFFDSYFYGRKIGYAIKIGQTFLYKSPLDLNTHFRIKYAPQSFMYVPNFAFT